MPTAAVYPTAHRDRPADGGPVGRWSGRLSAIAGGGAAERQLSHPYGRKAMLLEPTFEVEPLSVFAIWMNCDVLQIRHSPQEVHSKGNHDSAFRQVMLYAALTSVDPVWGWLVLAYQGVEH